MIRCHRFAPLLAVALATIPALGAFADKSQPTIQLLEIFDLTGDTYGPVPAGINLGGKVVGHAESTSDFQEQGFIRLKNGRVSPLIFPDSVATYPMDINAADTICGFYTDTASMNHGWFYAAGAYSSFDVPGAMDTEIFGINDAGDFVGNYSLTGTGYLPFLDSGGTIVPIDLGFSTTFTTAEAISSNGMVTGLYRATGDTVTSGFIRTADGTITSGIRYPGALSPGTYCLGINSRGWVVGNYWTEFNGYAFLFVGPNHYISYSVQNAESTAFTGINDHGRITGYYVTSDGQAHGLILQVLR